MLNVNCRDCMHYNYKDDKCRLGTDKEDCWDYEPQEGTLDYEEENEDDEW